MTTPVSPAPAVPAWVATHVPDPVADVDPTPDPPPPAAGLPPVSSYASESYATGGVPLTNIEGGWEGVYRRRRRQTLTFLAGLVGVLLVGFVAWLTYSGVVPWPFGGKIAISQTLCTHSKPISPKKIPLRVYNGSSRTGLASQVASQLKAFGFPIRDTGNDPLESKLRTPIEIRHGENGDVSAATTSAYLVGKVRDVQDDRQDGSVDVVLGPTFTRVHTRSELAKSLAAVTRTLPLTCPLGVTPPATATPTPSTTPRPTARVTPKPKVTPKR